MSGKILWVNSILTQTNRSIFFELMNTLYELIKAPFQLTDNNFEVREGKRCYKI